MVNDELGAARMASTIVLLLIAVFTMVTAAFGAPEHHAAATGLAGFLLASAAIIENRQLIASGASKNVLSAATARHFGSVWAWAAVSLFLLHGLGFVAWPAWRLHCLAFAVVALVCFSFGGRAAQDTAAGREDWEMLMLARRLTQVQLVGMLIALSVLVASGETGCMLEPGAGCTNWAVKNLFFFGEAALALISANALWTSRHMRSTAAAH